MSAQTDKNTTQRRALRARINKQAAICVWGIVPLDFPSHVQANSKSKNSKNIHSCSSAYPLASKTALSSLNVVPSVYLPIKPPFSPSSSSLPPSSPPPHNKSITNCAYSFSSPVSCGKYSPTSSLVAHTNSSTPSSTTLPLPFKCCAL